MPSTGPHDPANGAFGLNLRPLSSITMTPVHGLAMHGVSERAVQSGTLSAQQSPSVGGGLRTQGLKATVASVTTRFDAHKDNDQRPFTSAVHP